MVGFAQMKPGELLMESERAIGDARLHRLHKELIEERNSLKTNERVNSAAAAIAFTSMNLPGEQILDV